MNNSKGFSLVEVMLTMGISLAGLYAVSTFVLDQGRLHSEAVQKYEAAEIKTNLHSALNSREGCQQVVTSILSPLKKEESISIDKIVSPQRDLNLQKNKAVANSVSRLRVKDLTFKVIDVIQGTNNQFLGQYEIQLESDAGKPLVPIKVRQIIKTNSSGILEGCVFEVTPSCPSGEIFSGLDQSGVPLCVSLACPSGNVLRGLSSSGEPDCVSDEMINQRVLECVSGEYISGVSSDGNVKCFRPR